MFRSRKFETDEVPIIKAPLIHMLFLLAFTSILIVLQSLVLNRSTSAILDSRCLQLARSDHRLHKDRGTRQRLGACGEMNKLSWNKTTQDA